MSSGTSFDDDSLSLEAMERIDRICTRFEQAWQAGERPELEPCLEEMAQAERNTLLRELLRLDLWYRRQAGEHLNTAEYRRRFQGYESAISAAFQREETSAADSARAEGTSRP